MVMDVVEAAARLEAAGRRVIHMEIGQPAAGAPASAISAARAALTSGGPIGYTQSLGLPSLRGRIARHYAERHRVDVDPGRVVVTTGSSAAFLLAFLSMLAAGDRIAVANPGYPPYGNALSALGCEAVPIEISAATRFGIAPEDMIAAHRKRPLRAALVASPANPTGTMMTPDALGALMRAEAMSRARALSSMASDLGHPAAPLPPHLADWYRRIRRSRVDCALPRP